MILQPNVITKITTMKAMRAFGRAHQIVFSKPAPGVLVRTLTAWSAFETWLWRSMHDFNMVNLRGTWKGAATSFKAGEIINGKEVFLEPSADNLFAAFDDEFQGAEGAIRFVGTASNPTVRPNRYQPAWDAANAGDLPGFTYGLAHPTLPGIAKVPGFYTANPRVYLAGVQHCYDQLTPEFVAFEALAPQ